MAKLSNKVALIYAARSACTL